MPYMIVKKGDEWCVFKHDEDNKPVDSSHGCHPSMEKAKKQMAALYVAENKAIDIEEIDWFYDEEIKAKRKKDGDTYRTAGDFLVVGNPEKVDTWHLPVRTDGKLDKRLMGAAHAALTSNYRGHGYQGPDKAKALAKLKKLYKEADLEWPEEGKALKMYDEYEYYVPWGITTLAEAIDGEKAHKEALEIGHLVSMFQRIVENISGNIEVKDKGTAIQKVADELAKMLGEELDEVPDKDSDKSFKMKHMTGMAEGHKHEIMGDMTSEKAGHKHKVKNGKVQMADGHTHPMPEHEEDEDKKSTEKLNKSGQEDYFTIKSIGDDRVGSYAVLWGDEGRKDLTGEFFDDKTEELTAIYDTVGRLPYIYHHGMDKTLKTAVIGVVDTLKKDSVGLWYEAQLKLADDYGEYVKKLLAEKKLKTSSQTFQIARQVDSKTGRIERWPIVEITATPTPAEYRMQPIEFLKSAYQTVGCEDIGCLVNTKYGVTPEQDDQGAEKARLLLELEQARLVLLD